MHITTQGLLAPAKAPLRAVAQVLNQIRTATKRVSSSRTNMKDSAGRRLGPKKFESSFVKPGQIIMRQRGTKIHPGENVGLGKDHTIFALEPGYVRFYLDPFHPLRKYVGVALKKDIMLPYPHFEPRVRRFGYNVLKGAAAEAEENRMSRKEHLAQPELKERAQKKEDYNNSKIAEYTSTIQATAGDFSEQEVALGAARLLFISKHLANETLTEAAAADQATFNYVHDAELASKRGESSADELATSRASYIEFAKKFDGLFTVDFTGAAHARLSTEALEAKQAESRAKLDEFSNVKLSTKDLKQIENIISQPGVFSKADREALKQKYIPIVLPESVPGTVVEVKEGGKLPKGAVPVRTYDPTTRSIQTVYRTKDAFLSAE